MRHRGSVLAAVVCCLVAGHPAPAAPVLQNNRAGPAGSEVRFNPSIAAAPGSSRLLAIGYTTATTPYGARVAISRDAGVTWTPTAPLPLPRGAADAGETTVGFSRGRLVVTYLGFHSTGGVATPPYVGGLLAVSSTDFGKHWSRPTTLQGYSSACGRFPITPAMSSDRGTVVVTWLNQEGVRDCQRPTSLSLAVSRDGGATWRTKTLPYRSTALYGKPSVAVAGSSVLIAARRDCHPYPPTPRGCPEYPDASTTDLLAYYSGDGGRTFSAPKTVAPNFGIDGGAVAIDAVHHTLVAINTPFSDNPALGLGLQTEDQVWTSTDNAKTWRQGTDPLPFVVGGAAPSLAVSEDGSTLVFVADVQTALRAGAVPVLSTSRDRGATWSCPVELATTPTPWSSGYSTRTGLVLTGGLAHPVWPDSREFPAGPAETLYTATVSIAAADVETVCPQIGAGPLDAQAPSRRWKTPLASPQP